MPWYQQDLPLQSANSCVVSSIGHRFTKETRRLLVIVNIRLCKPLEAYGLQS